MQKIVANYQSLAPPYVLTFPKSMFAALQSKSAGGEPATSVSVGAKRKLADRDADVVTTGAEDNGESVIARTYKLPNMGPYPEDKVKHNNVRFTPKQGRMRLFNFSRILNSKQRCVYS